MAKYYDDYVEPENRFNLPLYAVVTVVFLAFIIYSIFFTPDENFQLSEIRVSEAKIVEMSSSDGPWVRVDVPNLAETDLWIEVSQDFYKNHTLQDQVGILLGSYDQFEVIKKAGKTYRRYQRQVWGVEEIYNSLAEAEAANPVTQYTSQGSIVSKEMQADQAYVVVKLEGKQARAKVEKQLYDQLQVGDKVAGQFESIGEFTKFLGVTKL